ncbi:MAG: type II toxin-antitoxin system VapC family toxin [Thermofilaceae archaeon]
MSETLYVVDASVYASILVKDEFYERAVNFVREYAGRLATLDLAVLEAANALWRHTCLLRRIPLDRYEALARYLKPLVYGSARLYASLDLLESAVRIASDFSITVYDALYVALAQKLGCKLASFDEELKKRLEGFGVRIVEIL